MRRRVRILAVAVLAAVAFAGTIGWSMWEGRIARAMPECPEAPPIVIDPGHGGVDGGTNTPDLLEKDVVLDVALRTRTYLEQKHVPVVLTRAEDTGLGGEFDNGHLRRDLNFRRQVADHCRATFMLSLHVNSTKNPSERGMIIFYQPTRTGRDAAYLFDDTLRRWPLHQRQEVPHPRKDFAVLKTKAPAILVEMGFITNTDDRKLLASPAYREQVAQALASACGTLYQKWVKHDLP